MDLVHLYKGTIKIFSNWTTSLDCPGADGGQAEGAGGQPGVGDNVFVVWQLGIAHPLP